MKVEFQQRLQSLITGADLPGDPDITYKSVFGAVAAYAGGQIFMSCGKFGVALKLDDQTCASLLDSGAGTPLKYFDKGHIKRNYVVLADEVLDDQKRLRDLIRQSIKPGTVYN